MGHFSNFYTGSDNITEDGYSRVRLPLPQLPQHSSQQERVWKTDFEKCSKEEDFEKYIRKYAKYSSNPYLRQAENKLEKEKTRKQKKKEKDGKTYLSGRKPEVRLNIPSNRATTSNYNLIKIVALIVVIVGVYKFFDSPDSSIQDKGDVPAIECAQLSENENNSTTEVDVENIDAIEDVPEEAPKKYKECPLCLKTGRCGGCYGRGQIYSCFDGNNYVPARWKDCECCEGSGDCPLCGGTGWIEDFGW